MTVHDPDFHDPWAANCRVLGGVEEPDADRVCAICADLPIGVLVCQDCTATSPVLRSEAKADGWMIWKRTGIARCPIHNEAVF